MRLPLEWLAEQFEQLETLDTEVIGRCLLGAGFELEDVAFERPGLETVITGRILSAEPVPGTDRLRACMTEVGREQPIQIVTAAPNVRPGDVVPVALAGSVLPTGKAIDQAKMRGVDSFGMYCSAVELGLDAESKADREKLQAMVAAAGPDLAGEALERAIDACFEFVLVLPPGTPVGRPIAAILQLGEAVLDVAITANRGDALCARGLARDMAALGFGRLRNPELPAPAARPGVPEVAVRLEDPDLCPRYAGQVVRGLAVGPSPDWLARRLEHAGIRAINNVVDAMNYVMLEVGQPLHAFDLAMLSGGIAARRARDGERLLTLDDQERELAEGMLVIADDRGPVAVAGVMGGRESAVGPATTDILIESAYFVPSSVRRSARRLGLSTESSYRFERGVDPEGTARALERAAALVIQVAGGQMAGPQADARHDGFPHEVVVALRPQRTEKILGIDLPEAEQIDGLGRLGFQEVPGHAALPAIAFRVPGWRRHDVTREIDLIEEVARMAGYDRVPETLPAIDAPPPIRTDVRETLRPLLRGAGYSEIVTPPLTSPAMQARVLGSTAAAVALADPLGEMAILRLSLLPNLLEVARVNFNHGADRVAVFEIGKTYRRERGESTEHLGIAALAAGDAATGLWKRAPEALQADFGWAKGLAEHILGALGLYGLETVPDPEQPGFHPGRAARLAFDGHTLAICGEMHPLVAEAFDLPGHVRAAVALFDPAAIEAALAARGAPSYRPIPRFPAIVRDLAVIVDADLPAGHVLQAASEAGQPLLEEARVFDRYLGPQIPAGKVSLALSLRYRSPARTLTDAEVEPIHQAVVNRLSERFGAAQRA